MQLMAMGLVCLLLVCHVESNSILTLSSNCCYSFAEKEIPKKVIRCHKETSSICSHRAVVFQLKRGRQTCALKEHAWVQKYLSSLKSCLP
ncbi:C-C motif chemokine 1 [Nycticebus coucang]|uniref:C-C motif chemokine 1 n=1 Tax=Nycticebus coucang TaxID=9470 RepID=UPI00234C7206|nr:C-C motif chemokine 1 [Nycticebus coucang]